MGFAVVAEEVRSLAQRCAQAAKDTASLIEESIDRAHQGKTKVDEVATAIRSLTAEAGRLKTLVDHISQDSEQQALGVSQIEKAIAQMGEVTHTAAANAEQSSAAAQELNAQSAALADVVAKLRGMVGDGGRPPLPQPLDYGYAEVDR